MGRHGGLIHGIVGGVLGTKDGDSNEERHNRHERRHERREERRERRHERHHHGHEQQQQHHGQEHPERYGNSGGLVTNVVGNVTGVVTGSKNDGHEERLGLNTQHKEPKWVGEGIPGVGVPSKVIQFYPQKVEDHIKFMPAFSSLEDDDEVQSIENLMYALSDLFDEFSKEIHKKIVAEESQKAADTAADIGMMFANVNFGVGYAIGAGKAIADEAIKAEVEKLFREKALKYSDIVAELISTVNKKLKDSAAATGASSYVSVALCEQSVSLNAAQAVALEEELDTHNETKLTEEIVKGNRTTEEKVTNRFSVYEFCPVENEEYVAMIESEDLQYDVAEKHFGQLKVVKKHGRTKIISTAVANAKDAMALPFAPLQEKGEKAKAEIRNHRGLPAYGDYIIRRFVSLFRVPFGAEGGERKPLIHLPPVYTHLDPNDLDVPMSDLMYPSELILGPGEFPPHMLYDGDRRLNQRRTKKVYEVYDIKTHKHTTVSK